MPHQTKQKKKKENCSGLFQFQPKSIDMQLRPRPLGSFQICPIVVGMWQVSGGHGKIEPKKAIAEVYFKNIVKLLSSRKILTRSQMIKYADLGFKTFDLADHYGPGNLILLLHY